MRKVNGVWEFNRKDTYNLNSTLSPVIAAGLKKFLEVIQERDGGVPGKFIQENLLKTETDEEMEIAFGAWTDVIREMIFAFDSEEPSFDGEFFEGPDHGKEGSVKNCKIWDMRPRDQEAWDKYMKDSREYEERVQKGYELFGKYFDNLWW